MVLTDCGQTPVLCLCAENFWYEAAQDSAQPSDTSGTLPPRASCQQSAFAAALQGAGGSRESSFLLGVEGLGGSSTSTKSMH